MLTDKWLYIINGVLISAFIGVLTLICLIEPTRRYRRVQRSDTFLAIANQYNSSKKEVENQPQFTLDVMKDEIVNIAPEVYYSVRLELDGGGQVSVRNRAHADLKSLAIKFVEVFIRFQPWDRLNSQEKSDLLQKTFALLKRRYPFLTQSVRLAFDDGRKKLEFKVADTQKMGRRVTTFLIPGKGSGRTDIPFAT